MTSDFLIIGGGIIGITLARELKRRHPDSSILLLEKEEFCGFHASGRNSGVLHAGFYYTKDSLKARFTRLGNQRMTEYCLERGLRINRCGKLVVARNAEELAGLAELLSRGEKNGVLLNELSAEEARRIEPRVKTFEKALFSPNTSTVDPKEVTSTLAQETMEQGVRFLFNVRYLRRKRDAVVTTQGDISAGYVINAAGLHADRIAKDFGFSQDYAILPFKGLYLYSNEPPGAFRTNVYPVPNLKNPFLGVHFTVTVDGKAKIGPTAIPAFWREHYDGLDRFDLKEFLEVVSEEARLLFRAGFDFRGLAVEEIKKYSRSYLTEQAAQLAEGVKEEQYRSWGRPGIRAQLLDVRRRSLIMDFCVEGDETSFHVLNAVSPAFTCSMPFSEFLCDEIEKRRSRSVTQNPA
jgi:L-2-hydroxyglutarate oxidase LhgO